MRVPETTREDPRSFVATVPPASTLPFVKSFQDERVVLNTARVVKPDPAAGKYKAEVILQTQPRQEVFADPSMAALLDPVRFVVSLLNRGVLDNRISREPLPVAVAVTENGKPRMVVIGDAEFLCNHFLMLRDHAPLYYSFAVSALEWMAERPAREGPRPKESNIYTITADSTELNRLLFLPVWLMTLGIFSLGAGVWIVRRR